MKPMYFLHIEAMWLIICSDKHFHDDTSKSDIY